MSGPSPASSTDRSSRSQISDEVARAVGALWQRRSGVRPASVTTEYVGDVVRCTIEPGADAEPTGEDGDASAQELLPAYRYEQEAQASVSKLTGRNVTAFVAKADKKDLAVTNAFILERTRTKH
jgi:hypothetical protein